MICSKCTSGIRVTRIKVLALHMVIWACSPEPHMALNTGVAPNQNNPKAQLPTQLGPLAQSRTSEVPISAPGEPGGGQQMVQRPGSDYLEHQGE